VLTTVAQIVTATLRDLTGRNLSVRVLTTVAQIVTAKLRDL